MIRMELFAATQEELKAYWRERIYDASLYAPSGCFGVVIAAYFEMDGKHKVYAEYELALGTAVVKIKRS